MAKQQALELGSVAGDKALEAAQNLHSNATRLALAVNIKVSTHQSTCSPLSVSQPIQIRVLT